MIDKQQILLIDYLAKKLKMFQEQWIQIIKQEEEELQQLRETYHYKQHKIVIDLSANELKVSRDTAGQLFKRQEDILQHMREELKEKSNMLSSEYIQYNVITLRKFQAKTSPCDQSFEKN